METRHPGRGGRHTLRRATFALLPLVGGLGLIMLSRCSGQNALLLTVTASSLVDTLDVVVKDLDAKKIALQHLNAKVDPKNPNRDISQPGQGLKLALEFDAPGHYLVYVLGRGPKQPTFKNQFFVRDFQVQGVTEAEARLVPLVHDVDEDGFPPCDDKDLCPGAPCPFFDCDDSNPGINPLADEVCGNKTDEDCSAGCHPAAGAGAEACVDADGDGEPSTTDCDDSDPCRSHLFREAGSLCNQNPAEFKLPAACQKSSPPPFCGDDLDQDCSGKDAPCVVDEDCDGVSPPDDCDDHDPRINTMAQETCGDGKDNNCRNGIDEGCVPCDVDGDGHVLTSSTDPGCAGKPHDDPDDYDAGVHPDTTKDANGAEGGTVLGALRGWCLGTKGLEKDGKAPREVDHDGDGLPAGQDGCPPAACDHDGDGFPGRYTAAENGGTACSPGASIEDCDDNDLHAFPGAPDLCDDGKKQNCVADMSCACDQDKDGYCSGAQGRDLKDDDRTIHPWATEVCNGQDDDCDGLIDEANPDPTGKPMSVLSKSCNDDNDGFCGGCSWADKGSPLASPLDRCDNGHLLSGLCVCTRLDPKTTRDVPTNRVACGGEDYAASASPRCIGARQPEATERCDFGDFNCRDGDVRPGEDFAGKNTRNCSVSVGECTMGKVTDCDLARPYAYASLAKINDSTFNPYWVCSGKLPAPEVCNGRDDDCTGAPLSNEVDVDGDHYLACSGTCTNLLSPFVGCGDCNEASASIHPGADELCNGVDENCNGQKDENPVDCAGDTCCPVVNACKNLKTDFYHCNACNNPCAMVVNNACVGGVCQCGFGVTCEAGQTCDGAPPAGTCTCKGSSCSGCCDNNHCRNGNTVALCGAGGASCTSCDDGNVCTSNQCTSAGQCSNPPVPSGSTSCAGGMCHNGSCCTGCLDGGTCQGGTSTLACGTGGASCAPCNPYNECDTVSCGTGYCVHTPKPNNTACTNGLCRNGSCCANLSCWDGSQCVSGTTLAKCGTGGQPCAPCTAGTCESASCSTGSCQKTPSSTGSCTSSGDPGTCVSGTCCTNCIEDGSCRAGTALDACGHGGVPCLDCGATSRICSGQDCVCNGCWQGGSCYINDPARCGTGCTICPQQTCKLRTCNGNSCGLTDAADFTSCGTGCVCIDGSACTTCYVDGTSPTCNNGNTRSNCGTGGVECQNCGSLNCVSGHCQ